MCMYSSTVVICDRITEAIFLFPSVAVKHEIPDAQLVWINMPVWCYIFKSIYPLHSIKIVC